MSNPVEKIGRGIDARERAKSGDTFNLANLAGAPASVSDLNNLANKATAKRDRLRVLADSIKTAIEKHRAQKAAEFAELGRVRTENGSIIDELGDTKRRALLEREVSAYARDARKVSAEERSRLLSELRDIVAKIAAVHEGWADPVSVLMRRTMADAKRATYAANLANAGPVAVENALRDAVIGGNAALAAAALDRLDAMPKESRKLVRFARRDVAESLVSEEWTKARAYIAMAEIASDEATLANTEAEGKRAAPGRKIALGVKKRNLVVLLGGDPEADTGDGDKPAGPVLDNDAWERSLDARFPGRPIPDNVTVIRGGNE